MGDVNLEIKLSNLDDRVIKIEESGGGTPITVDSELSDTSTNPVQNKVITEALNNLDVKVNEVQNVINDNGDYLKSINLFYKRLNGYTLFGNNTEGYNIGKSANKVTFIAKVNKNTDYYIKSFNPIGVKFRVVGFIGYPPTTPTKNSYQFVNNDNLKEYAINSGEYDYIAVTIDEDTTGYFSKDYQLQIEEGTQPTVFNPFSYSNVEISNKLNLFQNVISKVTKIDQTAYQINIESAYIVGNILFLTASIKSLTEDTPPGGRTWIPIITLPHNSLVNMGYVLPSRNSYDSNHVEVSIANSSKTVSARGGSIERGYLFSTIIGVDMDS